MITVTGKLPVGVEFDGKTHRDFVIRPRLVRDSVEVMEDPLAQNNDAYRGVALIARQIEKLGDLPKDRINTELALGMFDADMATIMEASARLEGRLITFRAGGAESAQAAPGAD